MEHNIVLSINRLVSVQIIFYFTFYSKSFCTLCTLYRIFFVIGDAILYGAITIIPSSINEGLSHTYYIIVNKYEELSYTFYIIANKYDELSYTFYIIANKNDGYYLRHNCACTRCVTLNLIYHRQKRRILPYFACSPF